MVVYMFFPVKSNGAGFKEETLFFSLLREAFEPEEAFAFQQFPFNSPNEAFRYELDVLFFHKNLGLFIFEVKSMETRVAVMSIIVEDPESVEKLNAILHDHGEYIIGRMGIPYRKRKISIISIALDAPQNTLSALAGKIGSLRGISVKTAYSGIVAAE